MKTKKLRLPVKYGLGTIKRMTLDQAKRFGEREFLTRDLREAGFKVSIFRSTLEIHGSEFFRICIGKIIPKAA